MKTQFRELTKGQIRDKAIILLESRGVDCWKQNNLAVKGRKFIGRKGLPDVCGFMKATGLFVGCEIKTVNDRLSNDQIVFLSLLSISGGLALIAKQDDMGIVILEDYKPD